MYDFDTIINRSDTCSMKYAYPKPEGAPEDVVPMWVADMDFQVLPEIKNALMKQINHGVYGYTALPPTYLETVCAWMDRRHGWKVEPDWILITPGVVAALKNAINVFTEPGDRVLIQPPVYYHFIRSIELNGRVAVENPLVLTERGYEVNFGDFERKIAENQVKLFLLCSPHNPVGRVWSREELGKMGEICLRHNVVVAADEIHHDFIFPGNRFVPFSEADPELKKITLTCTAPSKTFNLAGMKTSNIIIENPELYQKFKKGISRSGLAGLNSFGAIATEAAYRWGDRWVDELVAYVEKNFQAADAFFKRRIPRLKLMPAQGLYLAWVDCRDLGADDKSLNQLFLKCGVWPDKGVAFGTGGSGFMRFNFACPRQLLDEVLERIARGLDVL